MFNCVYGSFAVSYSMSADRIAALFSMWCRLEIVRRVDDVTTGEPPGVSPINDRRLSWQNPFLDFKLSPCECCIVSFGWFPRLLNFMEVFPKRRYVKFRRWGITQKKGRDKNLFSISNFRLVVNVVSFGWFPGFWALWNSVTETSVRKIQTLGNHPKERS